MFSELLLCFRSFFWDFGALFQGSTKSKTFSKAASPKMLKLIQTNRFELESLTHLRARKNPLRAQPCSLPRRAQINYSFKGNRLWNVETDPKPTDLTFWALRACMHAIINYVHTTCTFFGMFSTSMNQFLASNSHLFRWHVYFAKRLVKNAQSCVK